MEDKKLIIVIDERQNLLLSWGRDAVSFGGLMATAYFVNVMMPPSGWVNAALAISWILWLAGKGASRSKKMTVAELREWAAKA